MSEETQETQEETLEESSSPVETAETAEVKEPADPQEEVVEEIKEEVAVAEEAKPKRKPAQFPKWHEPETSEYTFEEFEEFIALYDETMKDITEGEIVQGRVVAIESGDVIVDVGFKSEGSIPMSEFTEPDEIVVGADIEVFLESIEDQEGQLVISKQKADFMKVWDTIKDSYEAGTMVDGQILRRIKGGLVVDLFGVDAFLPGSQVALKQTPNLDQFLGQQLPFKIIKLNKSRRNIVVSRRVVLEQEKEVKKNEIMGELEKGQVRKGAVKNITDFGAFVDLGGIDGLLHITDMSWGRIGHPSELVNIGQEIMVAILDFDPERERISLGLKQLQPYPWTNVEERYPVDEIVNGRVVSITDYGAFVELEKGVEGLVHISEMSWTKHITHPSKIVSINEEIKAMVLKVDPKNEKISLGMKQVQPDPWLALDDKFPIGTVVHGNVRNLTAFGAFVELEEGIDGLVHISDMSWTKRIKHPSDVVTKGDDVDVMVMNIDKAARRISLGIKQVEEDPWLSLSEVYPINTETSGKIVRLLDRGVVVELPNDVEGFVPISQLNHPDIKRPADAFSEGDDIPLKVIEFDAKNRRIVLSVKSFFKDRERSEIDGYLESHPIETTNIGEVVDLGTDVKEGESDAVETVTEASDDTLGNEEPAADTPEGETVAEAEPVEEEAAAEASDGAEAEV
ncbi:MAG: 30S ribosomal protein S1, partial [Gemmatimonadota bacterium]|nr:30S ribosomal protein S1 [Gemmatimonadota bacterium]